MSMQTCQDTSEAVEFCERYNLYLKPIWKIKISVQLPALKSPGQAISSWEVMEKLRNMIKPDEFTRLKVLKTNLILIQFECEVEKKASCKRVLQKLQSNCMKLSGFTDVLKIRAALAKLNYPSRHDWDSFFRDAKNNDEMKPGERPDTIYLQDLPAKWFSEESSDKPSEFVLKKVFQVFGEIRLVAIPSKKTYHSSEMFGRISTLNNDLLFDAYVQYKEYISFVKAMDALKGMKLLQKTDGMKAFLADIKVDFDKTRYLSEQSIKCRAVVLKQNAATLEPPNMADKSSVQVDSHTNCIITSKDSEVKKETAPEKKLEKINNILSKAKVIREKQCNNLMKALLHKAEVTETSRKAKEKEEHVLRERLRRKKLLEKTRDENQKKKDEAKKKQLYLLEQEKLLREKLLKSLKQREQRRIEQFREKLRKDIAGKRKVLKSVMVISSRVQSKLSK